jgi:hypothetical protein
VLQLVVELVDFCYQFQNAIKHKKQCYRMHTHELTMNRQSQRVRTVCRFSPSRWNSNRPFELRRWSRSTSHDSKRVILTMFQLRILGELCSLYCVRSPPPYMGLQVWRAGLATLMVLQWPLRITVSRNLCPCARFDCQGIRAIMWTGYRDVRGNRFATAYSLQFRLKTGPASWTRLT